MRTQENLAVQNTDAYKRETIVNAFVSIEMVAAIVCMAFFWFTIVSFDADSAATRTSDPSANSNANMMAAVDMTKSMQLANSGNLDEALREVTVLVQKKPHDAVANIAAGNVYVLAGDLDGGLKYLKKGVALSHRNPDVILNYARKLVIAKHLDDALGQYDAAIKAEPRAVVARTELAKLYLDNERPDDAAVQLAAVCDANPNNYAARKLRGIALARSGKLKPGLEEYMLAIAQEGQSGPPEALKSMLGNTGASSMDRVIYELEQQVNNRPTEYVPKLRLAQLYTYGGNPKAAKELLLDARRQAPSNAEVQRTLAVVMKQLGEDNQAIGAFGLSVKLEEQTEKEKRGGSQSQ
jgi:predicted Zn-dependent protease